jgi:hypothetical protein
MKHLIIIAYGCRSKCPAAATAPDETDDARRSMGEGLPDGAAGYADPLAARA